jgi:hypothetical protein
VASKLWVLIGGGVIFVIALVLWPIFAAGEPWLIWALQLFLLGGAVLVLGGLRSRRRVFRYALAGVPIGFLVGGLGFFFLVRGGTDTSGGFDDLVAFIAGILGAFVGSILGGAIGAAIGARRDRSASRATRTSR